jgi:hypothetical protein
MPPAVNGTTIVMGRSGYGPAMTLLATSVATMKVNKGRKAGRASRRKRKDEGWFMMCLLEGNI